MVVTRLVLDLVRASAGQISLASHTFIPHITSKTIKSNFMILSTSIVYVIPFVPSTQYAAAIRASWSALIMQLGGVRSLNAHLY